MGQSQSTYKNDKKVILLQQLLEQDKIQEFLQNNKYEFLSVLKNGDFSLIINAFSQNLQCKVAIKILQKEYVMKCVSLKEFDKKIEVLSNLKNQKYVLPPVEKIKDKKHKLIAIVTELCDCNLSEILELNNLNFDQIIALTYQLLQGLTIFQENNISNCFIKPENVLFSKSKNQFLIANSGFNVLQKKLNSLINIDCNKENIQYKSLEMTKGQQEHYETTDDVFSIGQIIVEAIIQRNLDEIERQSLKRLNLLTVFPFLQNSPHKYFIDNTLCKMVDPEKNKRLPPNILLQNLKKYNINEDCLKFLNLQKHNQQFIQSPKKPKKHKICYIDGLGKGTDSDILEINLNQVKWYKLGWELAKNIATSIEKCQNVTQLTLGLAKNGFGSEGAKSIGISIEKCQKIKSLSLDLQWNKLGAEGVKYIGISLEKCQNISSLALDLSQNSIGLEGAKKIGGSLQKCQNLTSLTLSLGNNGLGQEGAKILGLSIEKCIKISHLALNLFENNLMDKGARNITNSLKKCQNLTFLSLILYQNDIGVEGARHIGVNLEQCLKISSLTLSLGNNKLGADGAKHIGISIGKFQNISCLSLVLYGNDLGIEGSKNITMYLEKCQNITSFSLDLSNNNLGTEGVKNIGINQKNCQSITSLTLILSNNNLEGEAAKHIGVSIQKCSRMTFLNLALGNNNIGAEGARNILNSLSNCQNLISLTLALYNNNLYQEDMSLEKLQNISILSLDLSWNKFGQKGASHLITSLEKCEKISYLFLDLTEVELSSESEQKLINKIFKLKRLVDKQIKI